MEKEFFMYRGYPLVRSHDQIYFGFMTEPYVVMIEIKHHKKLENGLEIADQLAVYQISTKEANPLKATVNQAKRTTLYDAIDLGYAWLKRAEKNAKVSA